MVAHNAAVFFHTMLACIKTDVLITPTCSKSPCAKIVSIFLCESKMEEFLDVSSAGIETEFSEELTDRIQFVHAIFCHCLLLKIYIIVTDYYTRHKGKCSNGSRKHIL